MQPVATLAKPPRPTRARQHQNQAQTPAMSPSTKKEGDKDDGCNVNPSQATTASEPSSPMVKSPEKPVPRPAVRSSSAEGSLPGYTTEGENSMKLSGDSYPLASSQLMVPESLLMDNARRPPAVILDSDEEDWEE